MNEMIERVEKRLREWCEHGCVYPQTCRCRKMAIAAIEAMREPNEKMCMAGKKSLEQSGAFEVPSLDARVDMAEDAFIAMIDAALSTPDS